MNSFGQNVWMGYSPEVSRTGDGTPGQDAFATSPRAVSNELFCWMTASYSYGWGDEDEEPIVGSDEVSVSGTMPELTRSDCSPTASSESTPFTSPSLTTSAVLEVPAPPLDLSAPARASLVGPRRSTRVRATVQRAAPSMTFSRSKSTNRKKGTNLPKISSGSNTSEDKETNELPRWKCPRRGCGKTCNAHAETVRRHMVAHLQDNRWACPGPKCNRTHSRTDALLRHCRSDGGKACKRALEKEKYVFKSDRTDGSAEEKVEPFLVAMWKRTHPDELHWSEKEHQDVEIEVNKVRKLLLAFRSAGRRSTKAPKST